MIRTIVGIDPGTTLAYAIIGIKGDVIKLGSMREHDTAKIIKQLIEHGKPILMGCDKKNPPKTVEKLAVKLGARLVWPSQDLTTAEKKELVRIKAKNSHEFDALASALFVFESYKRLFEKIDKVLAARGSMELAGEVQEFLVKNDEMNINEALNIIENKDKTVEPRNKVKRKRTGPVSRKAEEMLSAFEEKNNYLRHKVLELNQRIGKLDKLLARAGKGKGDEVLRQKESRILALEKRLRTRETRIADLNREIEELRNFIMQTKKDSVIVKRIKDFSSGEFCEELAREDTLYVDNPDVRNDKVMGRMQFLRFIITPKPQVKLKDYTIIDASKLMLLLKEDFVMVDKKEFDKAVDSKELLARIIQDYKKTRT